VKVLIKTTTEIRIQLRRSWCVLLVGEIRFG